MTRIFITGTAGFIGYHLAAHLLAAGHGVDGYDGMTSYYDVALKRRRHAMLGRHAGFASTEALLEDRAALDAALDRSAPEVIVHLAAQAGVRHSLEHPQAYVAANVVGTMNVLEAARRHRVRHLLIASTSSVYGASREIPFRETAPTDTPMSPYAATKKATESLAHAHAHLFDLPTTMLRFFTVYGPWGRPDLALYRFVAAMTAGRPIEVYNHGAMSRDFTYVDDLARALGRLIDVPPVRPARPEEIAPGDSLSPVAPFRVVNIGAGRAVPLLDFIAAIETELGIAAERIHRDMQPGDVPATWADTRLLERLTGYRPETDIVTGIRAFVGWYQAYHGAEGAGGPRPAP